MASNLEKLIKDKEISIPEKIVAVTKKYGKYIDTGNDDVGQRYEYELKNKGLWINVFYDGWNSSSYAKASINGTTIFSGWRFWNVNYEDGRSYTYVTHSKLKLEQLEKLLLEVCRKHQRKK